MQEQLSIQANISLESCYEQLMCDEIDRATAIAKQFQTLMMLFLRMMQLK